MFVCLGIHIYIHTYIDKLIWNTPPPLQCSTLGSQRGTRGEAAQDMLIYTHVYRYTRTYIRVYIHISISIYLYIILYNWIHRHLTATLFVPYSAAHSNPDATAGGSPEGKLLQSFTYVYIYVYVYVYMYIFVYVYIFVYLCLEIHICIYIYIR